MAYGWMIEAEYADGFTLTEDDADQSPYDEGRNICHAVMQSRPVPEHGPLVRWSLIGNGTRYDVDVAAFSAGPDVTDLRPIYYRRMQRTLQVSGQAVDSGPECLAHVFGFQYLDETGTNQVVTREIQ